MKNASELKRFVNAKDPDSYFFSRSTMKFFGDTMANYGVRANPERINGRLCYVLYRRRPVKHGLQNDAYFDIQTGERVLP